MTIEILLVSVISLFSLIGVLVAYTSWGPKDGIQILMYHKLDKERSDMLTVTTSNFASQLHFLIQEGYTFLSFQDLIEAKEKYELLPKKSVILTFDDGYQNNFDHLLPLLKQHGIKATVFLPVDLIGKENRWDDGKEKLMNWETLKKAAPHFEYGLHTFQHQNVSEMTRDEFRQDIDNCLEILDKHQLEITPVLSYPYGKYPKNGSKFKKFEEVMDEFGLQFAVRIGNKLNAWPIKNPYSVCRIDIRGTDTFSKFKSKVLNMKVKMF